MILNVRVLVIAALALLVLPAAAQDAARPADWTTETHSRDADPNYAVIFPQDAVNTMTITIAPDEWTAMLADMTTLAGEFGAGEGQMRGGNRQTPPDGTFQAPPDGTFQPPDGQQREMGQGGFPGGQPGEGGFPGGMGGDLFNGENPMWVAVDVEFNGSTWTNVGMRFKGNSSLSGTWRSGIYKLPFKFDFDQFEDEYPEIDNQRFYGFKKLSFSSNWSDDSLLREKVTADVFRDAGLVAPETAFYSVYVDYGDGPVYFGLYTAVEVVEDTVIETQFADDSGNVYKPDGNGATFALGSFNTEDFDKETNENAADYSDVEALYQTLHADTRQTDPAAWRAALEAVFDVDVFLRWLAANTIVQNWDTYGQMSHNYYLYTNPETGLLTWIPWDNNMALSEGFGGRGGGQRGMGGGLGGMGGEQPNAPAGMNGAESQANLSFDKAGVSSRWPLIRYLLDQPEYYSIYLENLADISAGAFEPATMTATYTRLHEMIAPYVVGENGEQPDYSNLSSASAFDSSLDSLIAHAQSRQAATEAFLQAQ